MPHQQNPANLFIQSPVAARGHVTIPGAATALASATATPATGTAARVSAAASRPSLSPESQRCAMQLQRVCDMQLFRRRNIEERILIADTKLHSIGGHVQQNANEIQAKMDKLMELKKDPLEKIAAIDAQANQYKSDYATQVDVDAGKPEAGLSGPDRDRGGKLQRVGALTSPTSSSRQLSCRRSKRPRTNWKRPMYVFLRCCTSVCQSVSNSFLFLS